MSNLNIEEFLDTGFDLKEHLAQYLQLDADEIENFLANGLENMTSLHPGAFSAENPEEFYEGQVGNAHLFDLASWHLRSSEYIANTLRLQTKFAQGKVLDFGGGIGTHSISAASLKEVEHVFYVDLNPKNREFVLSRVKALGISEMISVHRDLSSTGNVEFDTLICLDVLEHLPDPSSQLLDFLRRLSKDSFLLMNWYFYKGDNGEYPFHFDDQDIVEKFFLTLQSKFIEVFHPYLITARCYKPR